MIYIYNEFIMNRLSFFALLIYLVSFTSCLKNPFEDSEPQPAPNFPVNSSAFVINEGGFGYGNASVDHINLVTGEYKSSIFQTANNRPLGDVLQDMVIVNGRGYLVLNNSSKIEVVEMDSFRLVGTITGLESPRYMQFVSLEKAYVSDFKSDEIAIVNPQTFEKTGVIPLPGWTEEMTFLGNSLYVTNRESDKLYVVDITTDQLVDSIKLAPGPASVEQDQVGRIWVYCVGDNDSGADGGVFSIDPFTRTVLDSIPFPANSDLFPRMAYSPPVNAIYLIQDGVRLLNLATREIEPDPFLPAEGFTLYGLDVDPRVGNIFVLDAKDYQQRGEVTIYVPNGGSIGSFPTGVIPNAVVFY